MPPIYPIGPLTKHIESISTKYEKEIIAWLDKQVQNSVLFVALGSGGTLTSEQLTKLARGLELSQQSFIMVVPKPNDNADAAFYSAGSTTSDDPKVYLPDGFVERTNGLGLVVNSWAPQMAVLNHPSTGAFLSHCGWNSTLESVKHSVPVIGWPIYAEQRMNVTGLSNEVGLAVQSLSSICFVRWVDRVFRLAGLLLAYFDFNSVVRWIPICLFKSAYFILITMHKNGQPAIAAMSVIDGAPEFVFQILMSLGSSRSEWDFCFKKGTVIESIDGHTNIIHKIFEPKPTFILTLTQCQKKIISKKF